MQARNHLGNRALIAVRIDNTTSRGPPSLSPGAAPGSQESGGVEPWPNSPPKAPPGATSGQRHQESSDPMEVDPVLGKTLQETRRPHRKQARVEGGAIAAASRTVLRQDEGQTGERHHSHRYAGKVRRAMSDEVIGRERIRKAASPPERGHAPGQPLGPASKPTGSYPAPLLRNRR